MRGLIEHWKLTPDTVLSESYYTFSWAGSLTGPLRTLGVLHRDCGAGFLSGADVKPVRSDGNTEKLCLET